MTTDDRTDIDDDLDDGLGGELSEWGLEDEESYDIRNNGGGVILPGDADYHKESSL